MRLSEQEAHVIVEAAREVFGPEAEVRLFGSRVDDSKRGGAIDLHITIPDRDDWFDARTDFTVKLWKRLGDRKIDIILRRYGKPVSVIDRIAVETGLRLQ